MKLDFSVDTENQKDVEDALNVLHSLNKSEIPCKNSFDVLVPDKEYTCKTSVGIANIIEEDEGIYRILAGSVVAKETSPSCSAKSKRMREQFISDGTIEIIDDKGIVRRDIGDLLSKSLVASIVTGTNTNGKARLIEKTPAIAPTKRSNYYNSLISRQPLSDIGLVDIKSLYRRRRDFFDFIFRDDIPEDMLKIFNFTQQRDGLEEIVFDFHVTFFDNDNDNELNEFAIRNSRTNLSIFDGLTIAYSWFSDFIRFLDNNKEATSQTFGESERFKDVLIGLRKCLVLCCKDM